MIQTLLISQSGTVSVGQRYPTIQVTQMTGNGVGGGTFINTDNIRVNVTANGTFSQIKNPATGLWHTLMVDQNQVVAGPGVS